MSASGRPLPELLADVTVAAVRADARGDQVAHAGEAGERHRLASHRHTEAGDLGEAAGHDGGPRVVADAEALGDAGGDGDDVLQGAGQLAADDVVVEVDTEQATGEHCLDRRADSEVLGGDHRRRGLAGHDLAGDVGTGERRHRPARSDIGDDLGHAQQRLLLEALGQADDGDPRVDPLRRRLQRRAHGGGRDTDDQQLGVARRFLEVGRRPQVGVEVEAGEVAAVGVTCG